MKLRRIKSRTKHRVSVFLDHPVQSAKSVIVECVLQTLSFSLLTLVSFIGIAYIIVGLLFIVS